MASPNNIDDAPFDNNYPAAFSISHENALEINDECTHYYFTRKAMPRGLVLLNGDNYMRSNDLPFEFNSTGAGANTRIDYALHDGGKQAKESIVLEGRVSEEDIKEIIEALDKGKYFLPNKVGIPDLLSRMPASWDEEDKDYFHSIERISFTNNPEDDYAVSAEQFVTMVVTSNIPTNWSSENQPSM